MFKSKFDFFVATLIIMIAGFCFLFIYLFDPDFEDINSEITKIEFAVIKPNSDTSSEYKKVVIIHPDDIRIFCQSLKCCSKKIMFFTEHPGEVYHVKVFGKKKIFKMDMCLGSIFYISTIGNFENTGFARKYTNPSMREFIRKSVEPLFYSEQIGSVTR